MRFPRCSFPPLFYLVWSYLISPKTTSIFTGEPALPFSRWLQRQPAAPLFGSCDHCFLQINAGYWTIAEAVRFATRASLDCRSVWRSEQSAVDRQRSSRQQLLLRKLRAPEFHG